MIKVKITENTIVAGKVVSAGTVMEISDSDYRILKASKKCEAVGEAKKSEQENVSLDETLKFIKGLNDEELQDLAKELQVDISKMKRDQAEKFLAEAAGKL